MNHASIWMPLYIGDYLADTIGLTNAQHGAYLMSMMKYWRKGESLTAAELREVCGKDIDRVAQFYIFCENRWHHKRVDEELEIARHNVKVRRESSMKAVEARRRAGTIPPHPPEK